MQYFSDTLIGNPSRISFGVSSLLLKKKNWKLFEIEVANEEIGNFGTAMPVPSAKICNKKKKATDVMYGEWNFAYMFMFVVQFNVDKKNMIKVSKDLLSMSGGGGSAQNL